MILKRLKRLKRLSRSLLFENQPKKSAMMQSEKKTRKRQIYKGKKVVRCSGGLLTFFNERPATKQNKNTLTKAA